MRTLFSVFILFVVSIFTVELQASSGGITGSTIFQSGCGTCHGSANSNTNVSIKGNNRVKPSGVLDLTAVVANSSETGAGINITFLNQNNQVTPGLAVKSGQGLRAGGNQLTHNGPKQMTSGKATFDFTLNAPSTPGTYKIVVSGNAINFNGTSGGDEWNKSEDFTITVVDGDVPELTIENVNLDCGDVEAGMSRNAVFQGVLQNKSAKALTISGFEKESINNTNVNEFEIGPAFFPLSIPPGESVSLDIQFTPTANTLREIRLRILSEDAVGNIPPIRVFGNDPTTSVNSGSLKNLSLLPIINGNEVYFDVKDLNIHTNVEFQIIDLNGNILYTKTVLPNSLNERIFWKAEQTGAFIAIVRSENHIITSSKFQIVK